MAFERIFAGRKAPSDVWPGPPRCSLCLVVTQEVSDVHRGLCKILMVVVEYHHHHHHHHLVVLILGLVLLLLLLLSCVLVLFLVLVFLFLQRRLVYTILITIINYYILNLD